MPSFLGFNYDFGSFYNYLFIGVIVIFFFIIITIIGVFFYFKMKYDHKVIIWKKINNVYKPVAKTRGTLERVGIAGAYWFRILKPRKYLPSPMHLIGNKEVHFFVGEDGEWYDCLIEDIDITRREAKLKFTRQDVTMTKESMAQYLEKRYTQETFWQKYGQQIILFFFILIVTTILLYALSKFQTVATLFADASKNLLAKCQTPTGQLVTT